jgi:phosphonate transport system substrate-binding protein
MAKAGLALAAAPTTAAAANASDGPNDGVVRYGVEPFDTAPRLIPIYEKTAAQISEKLGCEVGNGKTKACLAD